MHIEHIAIWTRNLEQLKEFYVHYFEAHALMKYINPDKDFQSTFLIFSSGARLELMTMSSIPDSPHNPEAQFTGLIHLALPQAKIIHLQRHPLDTCFAIYKTLFADAYPFSYQLDELGSYYAAYRQLMAHWQQVMPGVIYDQPYETLVSDIEAQTQQLLNYCELPWESACLDFHTQQQASTTASATQVRQPVYTSSVGKWRRFKDELAPLIRTLESAGIDPQLD